MSYDPDYDDFDPDEGADDGMVLSFERVKAETKKAWLVVFESDGLEIVEEAWLPKSECVLNTQKSEIEVPSWLVYEKELEKYEKED